MTDNEAETPDAQKDRYKKLQVLVYVVCHKSDIIMLVMADEDTSIDLSCSPFSSTSEHPHLPYPHFTAAYTISSVLSSDRF